MDIPELFGSHAEHDKFIEDYLSGDIEIKVVKTAILNILLHFATSTQSLYTKARELFCAAITEVEHLAVYLFLKHYPNGWKLMFEDAYILLCDLLTTIKTEALNSVFPPKWTEKIFQMENLLLPSEVKAIMFGVDPIPSFGNYGDHATGLAFCFSTSIHGSTPSSSTGLNDVYGLKVDLCNPVACKNFVKRLGLALINFIRMIQLKVGKPPVAGSKNVFLIAWTKYNLSWIKFNATKRLIPAVLIFQNEDYVFSQYYYEQMDVDGNFKEVLKRVAAAPKCSHPSYAKAKTDHCLFFPSVFYKFNPQGKYDAALTKCVPLFCQFLKTIDGLKELHCSCATHAQLAKVQRMETESEMNKMGATSCSETAKQALSSVRKSVLLLGGKKAEQAWTLCERAIEKAETASERSAYFAKEAFEARDSAVVAAAKVASSLSARDPTDQGYVQISKAAKESCERSAQFAEDASTAALNACAILETCREEHKCAIMVEQDKFFNSFDKFLLN